METIERLNRQWFLMVNAQPDAHASWIHICIWIADSLDGMMVALLLAYLLIFHRGDKRLWLGMTISIVLAMVTTYLIRKGVYYPRPFMVPLGTNFLEHSATSSFPSKHGTFVFVVAVYLLAQRITRYFGMLWLILALLVAWARVYLGVHWVLDMVGALLVGMAAVMTTQLLMQRWVGRYG